MIEDQIVYDSYHLLSVSSPCVLFFHVVLSPYASLAQMVIIIMLHRLVNSVPLLTLKPSSVLFVLRTLDTRLISISF